MNVFFDVDYTLISYEGVLRPHVREVFRALTEEGHRIYIWSGVGLRHKVVESHGLSEFVSGIFVKPLDNHRAMLPKLGIHVNPDFIVDDHSEMTAVFEGMHITPYSYPSTHDTELLRAHELIRKAAAKRGDSANEDHAPTVPPSE